MSKAIYQAVVVVTIDGRIAKNAKHNVNWSSPEDKKFLRHKINESDVVIVGNNTFKVSKKALTKKQFQNRNYLVFTRSVDKPKRTSPEVLLVNPSKTNIAKLIKDAGYKKVCVLGGTQIYSLLLKKGLIDDLFVTIEPIVFGFGQPIFDANMTQKNFTLKSIKKINSQGTILLHYQKKP